jgi:hypothetical protein
MVDFPNILFWFDYKGDLFKTNSSEQDLRKKTDAYRRCVRKDVGDDFHRRLGRVNVSVAHHKLLQNVVLNCARQLGQLGTLRISTNCASSANSQQKIIYTMQGMMISVA